MDTTAAPDFIRSRFTETATADEVLTGIDLTGKTAIVTGSSSGVGIATARALAAAGADVTMAVRNVVAGEAVAREIAEMPGVKIPPRVEKIDLLSLASVKAFAERWNAEHGNGRPLDMLINNAGLMGVPFALTEDGFESQMAVNFFGPFLLSTLLAPNLIAAAPSRVVIVSSGAHCTSDIHLDDLNFARRPYERFDGYAHAKTAANLLTVGFNRRFADKGVTCNAVTPSAVQTNLGRHVTIQDAVDMGWLTADGSTVEGIMKNIDQGAATSVWAATAPELAGVGGLYFEDCQQSRPFDPANPIKGVTDYSLDPVNADRLWEIAERMVAEALGRHGV
jgi:NAD(P)-dependent dehydrogenase (short-subunit alcohol dehydrogenase family)